MVSLAVAGMGESSRPQIFTTNSEFMSCLWIANLRFAILQNRVVALNPRGSLLVCGIAFKCKDNLVSKEPVRNLINNFSRRGDFEAEVL